MTKATSFILIFTIGLYISCSKDKETQEPPPYGTLTYFGFTLVDVGWDDPTDTEVKTNYVDEVSDFTNIADILVFDPADNITSRLQLMDDEQLEAILNIYFLLFEPGSGSSPSDHKFQLRSDYKERWDQFVLTNQLPTQLDKIGAFYIGEEPTWNGISASELKTACDLVKNDFPDTPIMIIESFAILDQLVIPSTADWIGFDQYFVRDPVTDPSYQANHQLLKSKLNTDQKLVIVMDTHHYQVGHLDQGGLAVDEMGTVASNYFQLAGSEPNVIALLGYFWPNGFDDPSAKGARGMSQSIRSEYKRIGIGITGK